MLFIKGIKQLLIVSLSICMTLSLQACSFADKNVNVSEFTPISNGYIAETVLQTVNSEKAEQVRRSMTKMLSNEYVELYMGAAYDIALIDARTEQVWYSNEAIYDIGAENYTEEQKKYAYSQLLIEYDYQNRRNRMISSYPECYDGERKNQITAEVKEDVLSVKYSFGTDMDSRVIFQVISIDTYHAMENTAKKAIEEGTISRSGWGRTKATYKLSDDGTYYILDPTATYIQTDNVEKVCQLLGYTRADVDAEVEKVGITAELEATVPNFVVTIDYTLEGADLLVSIDTKDIKEPEESSISRIFVLPGFGANTAENDGYMLTTDGGGAIIHNDNQSVGSDEMRISFYGDDAAKKVNSVSEQTATAAFPVFGVKSGEASIFAIVESCDAMSGVDLLRANQIYARNMAAPWFCYRVSGNISVGSGEDVQTSNLVYAKNATEQPYVIRYHMLYDTRASYNGMADYYRSYLLATEGLVASEQGTRWYEDVSIVGAIDGKRNVFGVAVNTVLPVSEYDSVERWLSETGIEHLDINYDGVFNGGVRGQAPMKLKPESCLGTREELDTLLRKDYVYPVLSIQTVAKSGNGIKSNTDIARSLDKRYAFCDSYNLATGKAKGEPQRFLIAPMSYKKLASGLIDSYQNYGSSQIMMKDAASLLGSDFNTERTIAREESKILLCEALEQLLNAGLHMKLDGVNAYTLKYGSAFTNVATDSLKTGFMDCEIPFIGMVLHGVVPYSVTPLNEAPIYEEALLDMIEYGANPNWCLITGDISILSDTNYTSYYSASATYWTAEMKELNEKLQHFYTEVSKETVSEHKVISDGFVRVTYSNGYKAYINRTDTVQIDGKISVQSKSFYLCDEKGDAK